MMENIYSETYTFIDTYIKDLAQREYLFDAVEMPGLTFSNELMHTDFACLLFSHVMWCPHPDTVNMIITQAVTIEQEFLTGRLTSGYCQLAC